MSDFKIEKIDHVALRASHPETSIKWYKEVLGLRPLKAEAWGDFPIFMLSGETGIAIFPADELTTDQARDTQIPKIDHFAFRVDNINFDKARRSFEKSGVPYSFKDHTYFHSLYLKDPDDHVVELTTLLVSPEDFYK